MAAIIIISAVATLALVLVIVLYKKQRRWGIREEGAGSLLFVCLFVCLFVYRERVKNWMVKLVGVNAAETVRYHKASRYYSINAFVYMFVCLFTGA